MWDVIDAIGVFGGLGFLAWFWWMAGRTVLDEVYRPPVGRPLDPCVRARLFYPAPTRTA